MAKIVLTLVDGMRPDGLLGCGNVYVKELMAQSSCAMDVRTVMPSVTLPCHMSLFHSVPTERHGIATNTYTPQVRPVEGLIERLNRAEKTCASFITWEELRDLSRPGEGRLSRFMLINQMTEEDTDRKITAAAIDYINEAQPDFVFLYLGLTDEAGHGEGWMSPAYLETIHTAIDCVKLLREAIPAEYDLILTADHGGHDRVHGTEMVEDMTIPLICNGPSFEAGRVLEGLSILDIAPTIAKLLGARPAKEWEGRPFV